LIVVYALVALTALANIVGTNALATQGVVLDSILSKTAQASRENKHLRLEIAKMTNLSYIESQAEQLGFTRVKNNLIVQPDQAVAAVR